MILYQFDEIDGAKLKRGEEEPLTLERDRIGNAETLNRYLSKGFDLLEGRGERQPGVVDQLNALQGCLDRIARLDADRGEWTEIVLNLLDESANLLDAFRAYREEIDYDPNRLTEVEDRLHLIHSLELMEREKPFLLSGISIR